jgi:hypothetical protein
MGKVSQHLEKVHSHLAAHHTELANCYKTVADFGKAGKSDMEGGDALRECLGKIADQHTATAAFHKAMASECTKAIESSDLEKNQLVPTQVSGVAPDASQNVRAVTRTGAKPFPVAQHAAVGSIDFNKFIGVDELDNL